MCQHRHAHGHISTECLRLLRLVLEGQINPGLVFDSTLPLAEVAEGYRAMDERRSVKVLLQP